MATVGDIFVPGGLPETTYVPREQLKLELKLSDYLAERGRILSLSGATKSGKTVLVRKGISSSFVEIAGGQIRKTDDLWHAIIDHFSAYPSESKTIERGGSDGETWKGSGKAGIHFVELEGGYEQTMADSSTRVHTRSRERPVNLVAQELLASHKEKALFLDDFHYIPRDSQLEIVRALKPLVFDRLPVIVASVPHRAFDVVRVEKEMTGRVEQLEIPPWSEEELANIAWRGFNELGVRALTMDVARLANESFASPHLMQDFCLQLCKENGVRSIVESPLRLQPPRWDEFFRARAPNAAKATFDLLINAPRRSEADRKPRVLRNGEETDIYGALFAAIAATGPAASISYEALRHSLQRVLVEDPPSLEEITAALATISDIARARIKEEPVVDYDSEMRILHVSDPFFAFYLRWGISKTPWFRGRSHSAS